MSGTLYIGNNNVFELQRLTNSVTGLADETATVGLTLTDTAGAEVVGQVWPTYLSHVGSGTYRTTLEDDLVLISGKTYTATVEADGTNLEVGLWTCRLKAEVRACS